MTRSQTYLLKTKKEEVKPAASVAGKNRVAIEDNRNNRAIQRKENKTGLPDTLKAGIENLSGISMDNVRVNYNSAKPAQLNAHAYAQGTEIHIATGQEKHLPHEAWHVVQQAQGRVRPTKQLKGKASINDDVSLEKEANKMGTIADRAPFLKKELKDGEKKSSAIQRKIGFEMEYAVPMSSDTGIHPDILTKDAPSESARYNIARFLTGGVQYDNNRKIIAGHGFKVVADKELQILRAWQELYKQLLVDQMIVNDEAKFKSIAIPEYVTDPFDELGTNADEIIKATLTAVSASMHSIYTAGNQGRLNRMPGTKGNYYIGVPKDDFRNYYLHNKKNTDGLDAALEVLKTSVRDYISPQVNTGVIVSSINQAHKSLLIKNIMTSDPDDEAYGATVALKLSLRYTKDVMNSLKANNLLHLIANDKLAWNQLKGIITLITNYIIGETYYRSKAFEDYKVVKNAVPLMSKVALHTVLAHAPALNQMLTDAMKKQIRDVIIQHNFFKKEEVIKALGKPERDGKSSDAGMLNKTSKQVFVDRMFSGTEIDHRGKRLDKADTPSSSIKTAVGNQGAIPLEYRRISAHPNASQLLVTLWPFVEHARELNMHRMNDAQKENALWWTTRSRSDIATELVSAAVQDPRVQLGMVLLPSIVKMIF